MTDPFKFASGAVALGSTSRTFSVSSSTGAGDTLLVVATISSATSWGTACTDSAGNVYTPDTIYNASSPTVSCFRSPGATGGSGGGPTAALTAGSSTVTVTTNLTAGNMAAIGISVPGAGAVDQIPVITHFSSILSGDIVDTPTSDNEICIAVGAVSSGAGSTPAVVSPFTDAGTVRVGTSQYAIAGWDVLGAGTSGVAQTCTVSWTTATGNLNAGMWTLQAGVVSGDVSIPLTETGHGSDSLSIPFTGTWQGSGFGVSAPVGSAVQSVTVAVRHHESSLTAISSVAGQIYIDSVPSGSPVVFTKSLTDTTDIITAGPGITWDQLPGLSVQVIILGTSGAIGYIDNAQAAVTYVPAGGSVSLPLTSSGGGEDDLGVTVISASTPVPLTESGAGVTGLAVPAFTDAGTGADALVISAVASSAVALAEAGSGADSLSAAFINIVQTKVITGANSGALTNPTTAGNSVIVAYAGSSGAGGGGGTPSITGITLGGSAGNFAVAINQNQGVQSASVSAVWLDSDCAGGQTTVTVVGTNLVAADAYLLIIEVQGSLALDKTSVGPLGAGTNTWTSNATAATDNATEVAVGVTAHGPNSAADTLVGPASPWINGSAFAWANGAAIAGYKPLSATGAQTYNGTSSTFDYYTCAIATFVPVAAPTISSKPLPESGSGNDSLAIPGFLEIGTGLDVLGASVTTGLADSGSGSDLLYVPAFTAASSATDSLAVTSAVGLAETGQATTALFVPFFTDSGQGSDSLAVAASVGLTDSGSGTDSVAIPAFLITGAGTESIAIPESGTPIGLADTGTGADSLAVPVMSLALAELGSGATGLFVPSFADSGAGTDSIGIPEAGTPVALPVTGSGAEALAVAVTAAVGLADSGAGSDALYVPAFADAGQSGDVLGLASAAGLTDSGAGTDSLAVPMFLVTGAGTDSISVPEAGTPIPLAVTGQGTDSLAVPLVGQVLAESGSGADVLAVPAFLITGAGSETIWIPESGTPIALAEPGAGSDTILVGPPLAEAGAGTESLGIASGVSLQDAGAGSATFMPGTRLDESGAATDALGLSGGVALADSGAGAEALWPGTRLADAGAGSDALNVSLVAATVLTDSGAGADVLAIFVVTPVALPETGAGADSLAVVITVGLVDVGSGTDRIFVPAFVVAGSGTDSLAVPLLGQGLAEPGSGLDSLGVTATVALADTGASSAVLGVMAGLLDAGSSHEALATETITGFPGEVRIRQATGAVLITNRIAGALQVSQHVSTVEIGNES